MPQPSHPGGHDRLSSQKALFNRMFDSVTLPLSLNHPARGPPFGNPEVSPELGLTKQE